MEAIIEYELYGKIHVWRLSCASQDTNETLEEHLARFIPGARFIGSDIESDGGKEG
jgi:hypothetical protein